MHFQIKQMARRAVPLHSPSMFYKSHTSHRGIRCPESVLAHGQSPVCLSTLTSANQTHSASRASWSEKGKERQRVCDAAVLPSPVNTQCMPRMSPHLRSSPTSRRGVDSHICSCFSPNAMQSCCSLTGRINGTLRYGPRRYIQNWSQIKESQCFFFSPLSVLSL